MYKITNGRLDSHSLQRLATLQAGVDQVAGYADKVIKASDHWSSHRSDEVFLSVIDRLITMCPTGDCCFYCCGSEAGHIDHYRPKSLYPKLTFSWPNFIHVCERCNTKHKKEQCAVIAGGVQPQLIDVSRPRPRTAQNHVPVRPPPSGRIALINPRREDPLDFLRLDILGTFSFDPIHPPDTAEWLRADYTIRVLGLNTRPYLIRERRNAYEAIVRFLHRYRDASIQGDAAEMRRMRTIIREISHQAVWQELVRSHARISAVSGVFTACPELLRRRL
jgi:hypothetical protein